MSIDDPTTAHLGGGGPAHDVAWLAGECRLRRADGTSAPVPTVRWRGDSDDEGDRAFDAAVLARCAGPTIDLGCGPGRFVAALTARNQLALGVDHSRAAVSAARKRGAAALCRNVFDTLPGEGRWREVLVMDGNIGIGGDPQRLLSRAGRLLGAAGVIRAEIDPDVEHVTAEIIRLESRTRVGPWFPWARIGVLGIEDVARAAGLTVSSVWQVAGREVAELVAR